VSDSILIVDGDADVLGAVGDYFETLGYEVFREASGETATGCTSASGPTSSSSISACRGCMGCKVLAELRRHDASVLLLTAHGDIETAARAMRLGGGAFPRRAGGPAAPRRGGGPSAREGTTAAPQTPS